MPIFEYRCKECGATFEKLILGSLTTEVKCPECNSNNVTKLLSPFSTGNTSKSGNTGSCSTSSPGFS